MLADAPSRTDEAVIRERFREIEAAYAPALARLAMGYERSTSRRKDLVQEIYVALWRSLEGFEERASLRTWVFRVAHNTAATFVLRERRSRVGAWRSLEDVEAGSRGDLPDWDGTTDQALRVGDDAEGALDDRRRVERVAAWVRLLPPIDQQLVLLQLEGFTPTEIHDVTGLSVTNVTTRASRLRAALRTHLERRSR